VTASAWPAFSKLVVTPPPLPNIVVVVDVLMLH
jgi:hypothetical protein